MLYVEETCINRTENAMLGESGVTETYCNTVGELYKASQKEYGRCISKVYIDSKDGSPKAIGWVFLKCMKYEDCNEYYLREVWVTVHDALPDHKVTHHYHQL